MRVLTGEDLRSVLDMRVVLDTVERGVVEHARGTVSMPPRHLHAVDDAGTSFVMSAYLAGMRALAVKAVSEFKGNPKRGLPAIQGAVLLLDTETGEPRALLDGGVLTALRTGAAAALAARSLSLVDAQVVGILGVGAQARTQVRGLWVVRDVQLVKAYAPTRAHVRRFCEEVAENLGVEALVADEPRQVVEGSDVVVTATNAREPVLRGAWLEPGVHVTSIGGGPARELDVGAYRRADLVAVDWREGALEEARDLRDAIDEGALSPGDIYAELGELVAGMKEGRVDPEAVTLYRSVGMALLDAATAHVAYARAKEADVGTEVAL